MHPDFLLHESTRLLGILIVRYFCKPHKVCSLRIWREGRLDCPGSVSELRQYLTSPFNGECCFPTPAIATTTPDQKGNWSIKAVLPCLVPDLSHDEREGIANGGMASTVFRKAIAESTYPERKCEIEEQLLTYCHLDTLAMVRMWEVFRGIKLPP